MRLQKVNLHITASAHYESNSSEERFYSTFVAHLRILRTKDENKRLKTNPLLIIVQFILQ